MVAASLVALVVVVYLSPNDSQESPGSRQIKAMHAPAPGEEWAAHVLRASVRLRHCGKIRAVCYCQASHAVLANVTPAERERDN